MLVCGVVEPDFLGYVFSFLKGDLLRNFNTHAYIDLTVQLITFENIIINTTLILLYIVYDTILDVFKIMHPSICNESANNVDFIRSFILKICFLISF